MLRDSIGFILWFTIGLSVVNPAAANIQLIPYGQPSVDGTLADGEWPTTSRVRLARFYGTDQFADFYLQWDENNLYFAGLVEDFTIQEDAIGSRELWKTFDDDSVELYIHPDINAPMALNETSRVIAFTPNGNFQRLDRGDNGSTTALETFNNTTEKIAQFLNQAIPQEWICPVEQPNVVLPAGLPAITQFRAQTNANSWRFEMALPWTVVGTRTDTKITGDNCGLGTGIFPDRFNAQDGVALKLNFKRINDDNGGANATVAGGTFINVNQVSSTNGTLNDEWTVYQGNYTSPQEWANFILRTSDSSGNAPVFSNTALNITLLEGRRVFLQFMAPAHGMVGSLPAAGYQIRYQTGTVAVDAGSWESMTLYDNGYVPHLPGELEQIEVIGLTPGQPYTVALRAVDELGRLSNQILSVNFTTESGEYAQSKFVTVAPTGRTLATTDGQPFFLLGETGLMPWLPLRGLYEGELCDEHPPTNDAYFAQVTAGKECGENGRLRNYSTEAIFFQCYFDNGESAGMTDIEGDGGTDNCEFAANERGVGLTRTEAVEGAIVAEQYLARLKAAGVNVLSVFVESLDLKETPIFFEDPNTGEVNEAALKFLDNLLNLVRQYDVYVIIRLYDTYYYRSKWSSTHWARILGKSQYDQFFDADLYDEHQARANKILFRVNSVNGVTYRDDPYILGWDILNEVDNKERFNTASHVARSQWLEMMATHMHQQAPRQLAFFSFLTWDPKDDNHYRSTVQEKGEGDYLGMDASLAYRVEGLDLAAPHGYYAHIANPTATPPNSEFTRPLELARGISYGFYHIRDHRPIIDTEGAPSPLFITQYEQNNNFTEADDKEMFLNSAWLHFTSGGPGANMRWPIDLNPTADLINQIPEDWRAFWTIMKNAVGSMAWQGYTLNVDHLRIADSLYVFTRHDAKQAVTYVFNPNRQFINMVPMPWLSNRSASFRVLNPRTGDLIANGTAADVRSVNLNNGVSDHVVVIAAWGTDLPADNTCSSTNLSACKDTNSCQNAGGVFAGAVSCVDAGGLSTELLPLGEGNSISLISGASTIPSQFFGGLQVAEARYSAQIQLVTGANGLSLAGRLAVDAQHIGQTAGLIVAIGTETQAPFDGGPDTTYVTVTEQRSLTDVDLYADAGVWVPVLTSNVFSSNVVLGDSVDINLNLSEIEFSTTQTAAYYFFLGYALLDGTLVYSRVPVILQIQ